MFDLWASSDPESCLLEEYIAMAAIQSLVSSPNHREVYKPPSAIEMDHDDYCGILDNFLQRSRAGSLISSSQTSYSAGSKKNQEDLPFTVHGVIKAAQPFGAKVSMYIAEVDLLRDVDSDYSSCFPQGLLQVKFSTDKLRLMRNPIGRTVQLGLILMQDNSIHLASVSVCPEPEALRVVRGRHSKNPYQEALDSADPRSFNQVCRRLVANIKDQGDSGRQFLQGLRNSRNQSYYEALSEM